MDAPRIFTPEYYERLRELEARSWWSAGMRDIARLLLDEAQLPSTGLLLDVGCGSGQTMAWFGSLHQGWRAVGVDLAVDALAAAKARRTDEVVRATATDVPLRSGSVDLVISLDVLQH